MIDVVHQISSVQRQVGSRVLEAGEARTVTIGQTYDATVEEVWDACTTPERIARWFLPVSGDLVLGGRYQLEGNAGGTVETCDPPHGFSATWEMADQVSWIEVRFSPDPGGGTRLRLEHIAHVDDEMWDQFGPGAVGLGWDLGLVGLSLHLASGVSVDHAEAEAWTASEGGLDFMNRSSEAWCEASIAAGTDPATARAAAVRIVAAYTGQKPPSD